MSGPSVWGEQGKAPYGFKSSLERGVADWDVPHHFTLNFEWHAFQRHNRCRPRRNRYRRRQSQRRNHR